MKIINYQLSIINSSINSSKRGSALVIALLVIAVLATTAFGVGRLFVSEAAITVSFEETQGAFYDAQGKLEDGIRRFRSDRNVEDKDDRDHDGLSIAFRAAEKSFDIDKDETLELSVAGLKEVKIIDLKWQGKYPNSEGLQMTEIRVNESFSQTFPATAKTYAFSPATESIRLKPLGDDIAVVLATDDPLGIDTGETTVTAAGQKGRAKRKLEIKIDRRTGTLTGYFDYALFAQDNIR